ncbi:MAG: DUF99 family protein [Candidatus Aenigmarchaeota archaeon]|nr:DUF99 family protein [Candidatus Aenigmarchaeota archaeon]MBU5689085.1 DUF99 family protein [Candidatus Aenigmarchaeota archaeon]
MHIKKEIRVLGIDDGPFTKNSIKTIVVGIIMRGAQDFDGMVTTEITVDGLDATEKIIEMINKSKYKNELKVIVFKGVTIGGFNVIDIDTIHKSTGLPVIIISRKKPNFEKIFNALKNFNDGQYRWKLIKKAGKVNKLKIKNNKILYFQFKGVKKEDAEKIILLICKSSLIPEPLRLAHMIASAIVKGESGGRP